ncbi:hypothetical protein PIB30_002724 [Stylosanthes scabra]|uniref:Uncharacterized protein n=1 Tax=Stylosanthes scabra TaxID=79078 RepID=A0ABU6R4P5_9FABA|nr:hypothetical protein [Stylosanthes scabra]
MLPATVSPSSFFLSPDLLLLPQICRPRVFLPVLPLPQPSSFSPHRHRLRRLPHHICLSSSLSPISLLVSSPSRCLLPSTLGLRRPFLSPPSSSSLLLALPPTSSSPPSLTFP